MKIVIPLQARGGLQPGILVADPATRVIVYRRGTYTESGLIMLAGADLWVLPTLTLHGGAAQGLARRDWGSDDAV